MTKREEHSFCRICAGNCGVRVSIDQFDRVVEVKGDKADPLTQGYICIKGANLPEAHNGPARLLHPMKRMPDGSFARIGLEQALDEIADKLRSIIAEDGPQSVAGFRGTQNYTNVPANQMLPDWLKSLGSPCFFSTMTIDQSAKWVSVERLGLWGAGRQPFAESDVLLVAGGNPLVSLSVFGFPMANPVKYLQEAKARGLKLIVIDPRRSETAQHADMFLQPRPGEDVTLAAGLLRIILGENWHDAEFCQRHVHNLDGLRHALEPYTPEYVEQRAGVPAAQLRQAAELFARTSRRGCAVTGTGPNMAAHSNLAEHLYECLNVVCGRFLRAGEQVPNPGILNPRQPRHAQVHGPARSWEHGHKSRIRDTGTIFGEMMSGVLPDEILLPGKGRIRGLFVDGGNPANAFPDPLKTIKALKALDLLVTIDPYLTNTAKLSHYILPPRIFFERADITSIFYETAVFPRPYVHYTPALVPPPAGAEVMDDWYVFWALAKRLGVSVDFAGVPLDMETAPTTEQLIDILARAATVPMTEIRKHRSGKFYEVEPQFVEPASPDDNGRFAVCPPDVARELAEVLAEPGDNSVFTHHLTSRRMRDVANTMYHDLPAIRKRLPYNPAFLHPADLAAHGLQEGDRIEIASSHGRIEAIVAADDMLRSGMVSMSHGWGGMAGEASDCAKDGALTSMLVSLDEHVESINAMPRMSAIPVNIRRVAVSGGKR